MSFTRGQTIRCRVEIIDASGVLVDPGELTFSWKVGPPGSPASATVYEYGVGAQIVRDSTGVYYVDLDTSTVTSPRPPHEALLHYRWEGPPTEDNPFAVESKFAVNAGSFT